MTWSLYRWVWLLDAPLFVGSAPAGALNRCRAYVPSRAIWGALTAELARVGSKSFPDYRQQGKVLREVARFTYLYPAALVDGAWLAWLPEYVPGKGLVWRREDRAEAEDTVVADRLFRRQLIDRRPGTAIDPESDSAAETSLRETECVMTHWRPGGPDGESRVGFVGYVFLRGDHGADLGRITIIFVGGDTRYGLGRMRRVEFVNDDAVFGASPVLDRNEPIVLSPHLLGHGVSDRELYGAKEALTGWDRTAADPLTHITKPCWLPGSRLLEDATWGIGPEGTWHDVL
jgi:hypothetical protein